MNFFKGKKMLTPEPLIIRSILKRTTLDNEIYVIHCQWFHLTKSLRTPHILVNDVYFGFKFLFK